ncbi:MAG TPA: hypothetical protein DCQ64_06335 [Candidatus Rokubacteria bacterium]|nr:hypothetical protein [Candidatus Rokubacteria bacterium]
MNCGDAAGEKLHECPEGRLHDWETDDEGIAHAVRGWVRQQLADAERLADAKARVLEEALETIARGCGEMAADETGSAGERAARRFRDGLERLPRGDAPAAGQGGGVMETHVLLGSEQVLTAASRMRDAAHDFAAAVAALQCEHQRHEEQMRQIVADFAEIVASAPRG